MGGSAITPARLRPGVKDPLQPNPLGLMEADVERDRIGERRAAERVRAEAADVPDFHAVQRHRRLKRVVSTNAAGEGMRKRRVNAQPRVGPSPSGQDVEAKGLRSSETSLVCSYGRAGDVSCGTLETRMTKRSI